MRQVIVQVASPHGPLVCDAARQVGAINISCTSATDVDGHALDVVLLHLSNARLGDFVSALDSVPEPRVSLIPSGALALRPPADEVADQVIDVAPRSPLEVFVAGLQSIGSWKAFYAYAAAAGVIVWLGLVTNRIFLLVGAMLIAPFAGPALNAAIATARGDFELLWRSLARYLGALVITVATTAALSLVFRQDVATELMASISTISATAVLLPLAAGAAGALHLSQGEGNSLVSGAATGMLIAASLAPPAGLIGMALVSGDIEMLPSATFLLGLQLVGINLAAAIVFRLHGLRPEGVRYTRGRRPVRAVSLLLSALGLAALLAWQFGSARPELQRATVEQRLRGVVMEALSRDSSVALVEANLRFTRASIPGQNSLLVMLYLQRQPGNSGDEAAISRDVVSIVTNAIANAERNVDPLIDVTLLSP